MALVEILAATESGHFFRNASAACGLDEATTRAISGKLSATIARRLKDKAAADPEALDNLLDQLDEECDVDLSIEGSLTDADAQIDGNAILGEIYGSAAGANAVLKGLGGPVDKAALSTLASINATAVLAVLAASHGQSLASAAAASAGGGLLAALLEGLLKGFLQSAQRQLAPKRRRRRYTGYFSKRRAPARRRTRSTGLEDIFREILGGRR